MSAGSDTGTGSDSSGTGTGATGGKAARGADEDAAGTGALPFACPAALAEPPGLAALRERGGLARLPTATGDRAWLVTRHADVRALCGDPRIGKSHPDPARAPRLWDAALLGPETNHATAVADHRRWRSTLTEAFGARRVEQLRPRLQASFDALLGALLDTGPPAELCADLARPFALGVICDLIGIPAERRVAFAAWSDRVRRVPDPGGTADAAERRGLDRIIGELLDQRRRNPADDLLTELAARADGPDATRPGALRPDELPHTLSGLLLAGYETVATRLPYGLLYLLADPAARTALAADPGLAPSAVEEVMRLAVPGGSWMPRYARADLEYGGGRIAAGDLVVFSFQSANRDERVFPDPDTLDLGRTSNPHLAFGHGKFFCLGAGLARLELRIAYETLFRRLPDLRLGCAPEEVRVDGASVTGGLHALPVNWSRPTDR
ncbi:cytochrome P450 [Kitasatospora sp. NPDC089913]|uniref:cytochrome P450 n=1 Tax=Kitasatospora sp. NPDC089913 TaxID=3364080 RepID=UPI0038105347